MDNSVLQHCNGESTSHRLQQPKVTLNDDDDPIPHNPHNLLRLSTMPKWNKADDAKLRTLWRTPHNGVDPINLDISSVKAVHRKYFPDSGYKNFAPFY
jgi:hypothetical protein